jgi:hypothetical protein
MQLLRNGRPDIIARMAADLCRYEATATESDAIRCLMARGYRNGDVVALLDDAIAAARQTIVADTMAGG